MDQLDDRLKQMTPLQRAVFALKETQARLDALEQKRTEPIAIVGMACRFPGGVCDPASYWRLLCEKVDAITEIPPTRWNVDAFYDPDPTTPGKMASRCGGFLDRIDEFDNHFFNISDREAVRIDPQQRLLLELAWEALEDAGLPPSKLRGSKAGVFVGISLSEYGLMLSSDLTLTDAHAAAGTSLCLAANRVSFAFGLQGPSMAVDTACSSSLVALHLACQHIRNGECDSALVGGVNLLLSPLGTVNLTKAGFCAADGRVRAFDAAATGYVRSEGAGVVVLKPLATAVKNADPIYAVVRGSAVNQNGSSNGLTAPSRAAQEQVLREAYGRAGVSPGQVDYVETQGTGTSLGDAIEATALGNVLRDGRPQGRRCAIGSVKTNIGHLEAASGMASLMKAALALTHRQFPPMLHFKKPNPEIPFAVLPIEVQQTLAPWPDTNHNRFAGVSAFGFGGSNTHVVLEEAPAEANAVVPDATLRTRLLPLSARTEQALQELVQQYVTFLQSDPPAWADVCHTAACRRDHHDCRLAILADSNQEAAGTLGNFIGGTTSPTIITGRKPYGRGVKIAFFYNDQFEEWKPYISLISESDYFTTAMEHIDRALRSVGGLSLGDMLSDESRWGNPANTRLVVLALQLMLTVWWRNAGIVPDIVLGCGVGELAAAAAAGILTTDKALKLAFDSGQTIAAPTRSAVLPFFSAADGRPYLGPDLDAGHWQRCLENRDGFSAAKDAIGRRGIDVWLGIGPASADVVPSLRLRADGGSLDVLTTVATLYAAGIRHRVAIDFRSTRPLRPRADISVATAAPLVEQQELADRFGSRINFRANSA